MMQILTNDFARALTVHPAAAPVAPAAPFDMLAHLTRQREFSERTFGPGARTKGVCDHIRKELSEIESNPSDLTEWIDVVILALDGAWRAGGSPQQIIDALVAKQTKNEGRTWPDWRTVDPNKAIEHDRSRDTVTVDAATLETMLVIGDKVRFKRAVRVFMADAQRPGKRHYKGTIEVGEVGTILEMDNDHLCTVEVRGGYQIFARLDDLERA